VTGALVAGAVAGYGIAVPVGAVGTYLVSLTARTSLRTGAAAALGVATADGLYALAAVVGGTALARLLTPIALPLRWTAAVVLVALAVRTAWNAVRRLRAGSRRVDAAEDGTRHAGSSQADASEDGSPHADAVEDGSSQAESPWVDVPDSASPRDEPRRGAVGGARAERPLRAYLGLTGLTLLNPTTVIYFAALVLGTRTASATHRADQAVFVLGAFAASASWQLLLAGSGALLGRLLTGPRGRSITALASSVVIAALAVRVMWP
jgi:arginine exporter protein ArgO